MSDLGGGAGLGALGLGWGLMDGVGGIMMRRVGSMRETTPKHYVLGANTVEVG